MNHGRGRIEDRYRVIVQVAVVGMLVLSTVAGVAGASLAGPDRDPVAQRGPAVSDVQGTALGNVYFTNETPSFDVTASGSPEWRVENYWNETVASGTLDASGTEATTLAVDRSTPGYYELTVGTGDDAITRSFAIVRYHDFSQYEESFYLMQGHFAKAYPLEILPLVRTVGAKHVRDGHMWHVLEGRRGEFQYPEKYGRMMDAFDRNDIEPLLGLWYGNTLYIQPTEDAQNGAHFMAPHDERTRAAFANYARDVVGHYPELRAVEVWNEYNWRHFSRGPASEDPVAYAKLLADTYPAIEETRSDVTVLAGGTAGIPYRWIETVLQNDGAEHMDTLSIHPYRRQYKPEVDGRYGHGNLERELDDLQNLTAEYNDGEALPIWITEYGYNTGGPKAVSVPQQTTYLVRSHVMAQAAGAERFGWYQFRAQARGNGLIRTPDSPLGRHNARPAYVSYATMTRQLTGATPQGRERVTIEDNYLPRSAIADRYYSYRYEGRDGQPLRVAWSLQPATAILDTEEALTVTDMMGRQRTLEPTDGTVTLELSGEPLYVEGSIEEFRVSVPERYRQPLDASISISEPTDDTVLERPGTVDLRIRNNRDSGSATVDRIEWSTGDRQGAVTPAVAIDAGGTRTVSIPLSGIDTWVPYRAYDLSVRIGFDDGQTIRTNRTVMDNPVPARSLTVDGQAGEVDELPAIQLPAHGDVEIDDADYGGPADLSAEVRTTWDDDHLYLQAVVTDDEHVQPADAVRDTWKGDSVQFAVAQGGPGESLRFTKYTLAANNSGVPVIQGINNPAGNSNDPTDATYEVRRLDGENRTVYEVALPWTAMYGFDGPSDRFSLTFMVNDNDGDGRKGWLEWGSGIGRTANTDFFHPVTRVQATGTAEDSPQSTPETPTRSTPVTDRAAGGGDSPTESATDPATDSPAGENRDVATDHDAVADRGGDPAETGTAATDADGPSLAPVVVLCIALLTVAWRRRPA